MIIYTQRAPRSKTCADYGTKVNIIRANAYSYAISAMCKVLNISRSGYYAYLDQHSETDEMNDVVVDVFNENQKVYGISKIKAVLATKNIHLSSRHIARIMHDNELVSAYTVKKFKPHKTKVNEEYVENKLHRELSAYIYWFNNKRVHSTLAYLSPIAYKKATLIRKFVQISVAIPFFEN